MPLAFAHFCFIPYSEYFESLLQSLIQGVSKWPQQPQLPRQPHLIKKITDHDGLIIPSTPIDQYQSFFCGMNQHKSNFSLLPDILSVGGC